MTQHTPGPWRIVRTSEYTDDPTDTKIQSIQDANGGTVLYTNSGYFKPTEANARLIAAAPEMLAIIRAYVDGDNGTRHGFVDDRARALLAKVEG